MNNVMILRKHQYLKADSRFHYFIYGVFCFQSMANGVNGEVTQVVVKAAKQDKGQEADLALILLHQVEGWIALDHRLTQ